jgi:hypothetical protein
VLKKKAVNQHGHVTAIHIFIERLLKEALLVQETALRDG